MEETRDKRTGIAINENMMLDKERKVTGLSPSKECGAGWNWR